MDWNNAYLIPLYNALLIPVLIFGLGLVVEGFGNLLTAVISLFFWRECSIFCTKPPDFYRYSAS